MQQQRHFSTRGTAIVSVISRPGAITGGILVGLYSDRSGRRRAMGYIRFVGCPADSSWLYAPTMAWRLQLEPSRYSSWCRERGAWSRRTSNELSPGPLRGFFPGFAYQCGILVASSVAYLEAILAQHTRYANAMALTAFTVFTLAAVVVGLGREHKAIQFGA